MIFITYIGGSKVPTHVIPSLNFKCTRQEHFPSLVHIFVCHQIRIYTQLLDFKDNVHESNSTKGKSQKYWESVELMDEYYVVGY